MTKQTLVVALAATLLSTTAVAEIATGDTSGMRIALSNNFAGNSWRQAMLKSWDEVATQAGRRSTTASSPRPRPSPRPRTRRPSRQHRSRT